MSHKRYTGSYATPVTVAHEGQCRSCGQWFRMPPGEAACVMSVGVVEIHSIGRQQRKCEGGGQRPKAVREVG